MHWIKKQFAVWDC